MNLLNSYVLYFFIFYLMNLRFSEHLWKGLATIGLANIVIFLLILFVTNISHTPFLIWIFIAIESACYIGVVIVRRHITELLR